jgi:hypothetical protein
LIADTTAAVPSSSYGKEEDLRKRLAATITAMSNIDCVDHLTAPILGELEILVERLIRLGQEGGDVDIDGGEGTGMKQGREFNTGEQPV